MYSSYTFAGPSETPISEREGYVVGDVIKYKHVFAGYGYTRTYQGNDVWLREFESGGSRWEVAAYNSDKGIRIDYLDIDNKVIYELKPFNPRSVKQGIRQLEKYNQKLGGGYKMVLEVY